MTAVLPAALVFDFDGLICDTESVVFESVQRVFRDKRDLMLSRLERIGVRFDRPPEGTFYVWGNLAGLPPPL